MSAEELSTNEALRILSAEEAVAKLKAAGYTRERCTACGGLGHHSKYANDQQAIGLGIAAASSFRMCEKCERSGRTWRAPLLR